MKSFYFLLIIITSIFIISCDGNKDTSTESCDNKTCLEYEVCIIENNEAICKCEDGFELKDNICVSTDPCFEFQCGENEECTDSHGEEPVHCSCVAGYQLNNNKCEKIPTGCEDITCNGLKHCELLSSTPTCICNTGYYDLDGNCIFDCRVIEGTKVNTSNNGCECESSDYYIDEIEQKCILKEGCKLDEADCGENGVCKEDLEKDWSCDCDYSYYFNGTTCVKESNCNEDQMECSGVQTGCCPVDHICLNDSECQEIEFNEHCQDDGDCEENEFCDPVVEKCIIMDNETGCIYKPIIPEQMNPLLAWQWPNENTPNPSYKDIMMAPVVANMTDDNNDGVIDLKDIPDVIFSSAPGVNKPGSHLRIIDGKTGADIAENTSHPVHYGSSMAVGDIDNDGKNEIIAIDDANHQKLTVFEYNNDNELVVKWQASFNILSSGTLHDGGISIADVDHDGNPEIIVGNYIFKNDGTEKCHSIDTLLSYGRNSTPTGGLGGRHISIVEDINTDGIMDIITGNQYISGVDCSRIAAREDRQDGYTAIADLDLDGLPEVVVISQGFLYIYDKDMNDLIIPLQVDTGNPIGGPPTIANFDNDPELEIAVAGTTEYRVVDITGLSSELPIEQGYVWRIPNQDASSRQTGSSLFDFEGDGIAEVLYADECYFKIYGSKYDDDGNIEVIERFKIKNSSITRFEYPLVVDVDNDGKSEVIVVSNSYPWTTCGWEDLEPTFGIKVFESPDNSWVRTRRIWNQHSYHVTNVNEDGSIPVNEEHNWLSYNNYRLNVQGKGVFNSPNFMIDRINIERTDCPKLKFKLKIKLSNKGSLSVNTGLPISIYKKEANTKVLITTINTMEILLPGGTTTLEYDFIPENPDTSYNLAIVADDKGNGTGDYNECNEVDNEKEISFKGIYTAFCQAGIGECMRFAPYTCDENNELSCSAVEGTPVNEICDDGFDNNCDGSIDETCGCNSESQECYHASSELLAENSRCQKGLMYCIGGENWGECKNDILPIVELCNEIDDDCDGEIDEDFPNLNQECDRGFGVCKEIGNFVCDLNGNMICNAIPTEAGIEICNDLLDNNCNGQIDERPCQNQ